MAQKIATDLAFNRQDGRRPLLSNITQPQLLIPGTFTARHLLNLITVKDERRNFFDQCIRSIGILDKRHMTVEFPFTFIISMKLIWNIYILVFFHTPPSLHSIFRHREHELCQILRVLKSTIQPAISEHFLHLFMWRSSAGNSRQINPRYIETTLKVLHIC